MDEFDEMDEIEGLEFDEFGESEDTEETDRGRGFVDWLWWGLSHVAYGCGLLVLAICLVVAYFNWDVIGPWLDETWTLFKPHLPWAAEDTLEYFQAGKYPYLPGDVELSDELRAMAPQFGFTEYDIQALIAGAARFDVDWQIVVAIEMNGRWKGGFRDTFFLAMAIAKFLDQHGYHDEPTICPTATAVPPPPPNPTPIPCVEVNPKHQAIMALYPEGGTEWLGRVLETAEIWEGPLQTARINPLESKTIFEQLVIFGEMLVLRVKGPYNELVLVDGRPVIISDPGQPPLPYPDVPDGFIICPYDGCVISGYNFGDPVYNERGELIRDHHPGVDLGGSGRIPVVAPCNGETTYTGWINSAALWISGITVAMICDPAPDDPTPICNLLGHGQEGSLQVDVGQQVDAGDWLFTANNTGFSFGDHAHWDIRIGGGPPFCDQPVNPMEFLR